MKAFNPETGKVDLEVNFPSGPEYQEYAIICNKCGTCAGGGFSGPDLPKPHISKYCVCPGCSGQDLRLTLLDEEN
jgi:hypothetical protein